jgi:hypothetical protein
MITIITSTKPKKFVFKNFIWDLFSKSRKKSGPDAVLSSLLRGFKKINQAYCVNPIKIHEGLNFCCVLSGVDGLRDAIEKKSNEKINKIFAGPNLVNLPRDSGGILLSNYIDQVIVPCSWVRDAYIKDGLKNRIEIWAAGVDESYWSPKSSYEKSIVLIYWKTESSEFIKKVTRLVNSLGYQPIILEYGKYDPYQYKDLLQISKFVIFVSMSESQGLSMAEAWSMNVPTFVWSPPKNYAVNFLLKQHNFFYDTISSAPYLSGMTGNFWDSIDVLAHLIGSFNMQSYEPRAWVLENMTDQICAEKYVKIVNGH